MRRPTTSRGVGAQTLEQLQRKHRRLDRNRNGAAAVLTKLQRGQSLNLSFERGTRQWRLSDGSTVSDAVAAIVTADHRVVGVGDALLRGLPSQTYRFSEA
jgi:hypothetical protein